MSERMNPEVKAKWLTALRSGQYPQARDDMHYVDSAGEEHFCCLAVLADLYRQECGGHWISDDGPDEFVDVRGGLASGSYLSDSIRRWAGAEVDTFDGFLDYPGKHLALLNDEERCGFPEIADQIEEHF